MDLLSQLSLGNSFNLPFTASLAGTAANVWFLDGVGAVDRSVCAAESPAVFAPVQVMGAASSGACLGIAFSHIRFLSISCDES